jgi:hypothetical protein
MVVEPVVVVTEVDKRVSVIVVELVAVVVDV